MFAGNFWTKVCCAGALIREPLQVTKASNLVLETSGQYMAARSSICLVGLNELLMDMISHRSETVVLIDLPSVQP